MVRPDALFADLVLIVHLVVIGFNVFGLVAVPLGGWLGWRFVRLRLWRWLHLATMAVVALQALVGRACFLTVLQDGFSSRGTERPPLVMRVVNQLIFWPLPMGAFTTLYVLLLLYVIALLKLVPVERRR